MFWSKLGFYFWALMVPIAIVLGCINYDLDRMWLFWINVVTVICSAFNAYNSRRNILSQEEFQRWLDGKQ